MLPEIKRHVKNRRIQKAVKTVVAAISPKLIDDMVFRRYYHRRVNEAAPELMDEKLLILKHRYYNHSPLVMRCADKYAVREYVSEAGYKETLIPLHGVYERVSDIDWERLPSSFALKCNHGSGYNVIVRDKRKADKSGALSELDAYMKEDYGVYAQEQHYSGIPRKILCEQYIGSPHATLPLDYKFFCSYGHVFAILGIAGRDEGVRRFYVDTDFSPDVFEGIFKQDLSYAEIAATKPESFTDMIEIAKNLSRPFPFVRVDLYEMGCHPLFGELTFTPSGCIHYYMGAEMQKRMGQMIEIGGVIEK